WSYNGTCSTYSTTTCNGVDNDIDPGTAGIQNGILRAGALATCRANFTPAGVNTGVFDLSGNVKEFTAPTAGVYTLRGGSYNNLAFGTQCNFGFTQVDNTFRFVNAGFRCCFSGASPP
ncbi:MAG: hypothetical protein Q8Q09_21140, partial [Deltaproteobacteria bacterium]|nr:hypothetical protein [Deltaproteobacteria bacterium]